MFTHPFHPERFLRAVYGTEVFCDYCRERGIPFQQIPGSPLRREDQRLWAAALAELPHERHAQVEMELATVNEMAGADEGTHLLEAAHAGQLPPDSVARGAPLALWFFLHQPHLFHEVFFAHEIKEVGSWCLARASAGLHLEEVDAKAALLQEALQTFFRVEEGSGRICTVEGHHLKNVVYFVAQVADRLQFLDVFTESGRPVLQRLRRALPVLFAYYPHDGTTLLKSHLRSVSRIAQLFRCFGDAVLGSPATVVQSAFDLERLKMPFHPLPDSPDMEMIRVKSLHLRYPPGRGRRQLKLETRVSDDPAAIEQMIRSHVQSDALDELRVSHAELQVRLRSHGRPRNYSIRLWPNRCSLGQTPLGDRFRKCLQHWGLTYAR